MQHVLRGVDLLDGNFRSDIAPAVVELRIRTAHEQEIERVVRDATGERVAAAIQPASVRLTTPVIRGQNED